jgi:alkaline phosphatase D
MKKAFSRLYLLVLIFTGGLAHAQPNSDLVSGPMLGQVDYRTATVWIEAKEGKQPLLRFWRKDDRKQSWVVKGVPKAEARKHGFNVIMFYINGLDVNTAYEYQLEKGKTEFKADGSFTTKELWQWRRSPPDFSFITGSCSYMNEPGFDRSGRSYGGDTSIYTAMARENAAFMLWLGDNWYTREVDYYSNWGLWYRAHYDRSRAILQPFFSRMPHYAIWDDHDFGPNDMGREFHLKEESRAVFTSFWANPSYGEQGSGIYTRLNHSDVDFFLLDDRTWRSSDKFPDSLGGGPNPMKKMFGDQQMEWLKNALAGSLATFKVIVTGSQMLNPKSPFDCFRKFPAEYQPFMQFLADQKITGVVFLTGDRHHSEIIKLEGLTPYPLYDITVSPLTSGTHVFGPDEKNNPYRVLGIDQLQNYARISVSGAVKDRTLRVNFMDIKGNPIAEWRVNEKELR